MTIDGIARGAAIWVIARVSSIPWGPLKVFIRIRILICGFSFSKASKRCAISFPEAEAALGLSSGGNHTVINPDVSGVEMGEMVLLRIASGVGVAGGGGVIVTDAVLIKLAGKRSIESQLLNRAAKIARKIKPGKNRENRIYRLTGCDKNLIINFTAF